MTPIDSRFSREHEWVRLTGDKAIIGITDHAQKELGDITFVELPAAGRKVKQFESVGVIESVKAASDIFSPLSGTVSGGNKDLDRKPELINQDPYGKGWILELTGVASSDLDKLMTADQYDAYVAKM
jgi:glycine cleavage system H protein